MACCMWDYGEDMRDLFFLKHVYTYIKTRLERRRIHVKFRRYHSRPLGICAETPILLSLLSDRRRLLNVFLWPAVLRASHRSLPPSQQTPFYSVILELRRQRKVFVGELNVFSRAIWWEISQDGCCFNLFSPHWFSFSFLFFFNNLP